MTFNHIKFILPTITFLLFLLSAAQAQRVDFKKFEKEIKDAQTKKEKADAYITLASVLGPRQSVLTFQYADSLLALSDSSDPDYYEYSSKFVKAIGYFHTRKFKEAKKLFSDCNNYFKDHSEINSIKCRNFIGSIHLQTGKADSAIIVFEKIITDMPEEETLGLLAAYSKLGSSYNRVGNFSKAIEAFEKTILMDSLNKSTVINSYIKIATIFQSMKMYGRGIEILQDVNINDLRMSPEKIVYFNNLGNLYFKNDQLDSAIINLEKGIAYSKELNIPQLGIQNKITLAEIQLSKGNQNLAYKLLTSLKAPVSASRNRIPAIDLNLGFANYHFQNSLYDSAIYFAKQGIEVADQLRLPQRKADLILLIAQSFEKKDEAEESNRYYGILNELQGKLKDSRKEKFIANARAKYMVDQKEQALVETRNESSFLKKWQLVLIIIVISLLIISLAGTLLLKKSKKLLSEKEEENELINQEIINQKRELIKLKSKAVIPVDDIISIESDGHYLEFYLTSKDKPEIDRNRLKEIKESLPTKFIQIHKSFIVNVDFIKAKYANKILLNDGRELPVSRTYKNELKRILE